MPCKYCRESYKEFVKEHPIDDNLNKPIAKRTRFYKNQNYILEDWSKWVSATDIRNYMLDDPLVDWLNSYGGQYGYQSDSDPNNLYNFNGVDHCLFFKITTLKQSMNYYS